MDHRGTFSLVSYYEGSVIARRLNLAILTGIISAILWAPLPFGSVLPNSILVLQAIAVLLFVLWIAKLVYGGNPGELERFQELYQEHKAALATAPFFHRHLRSAQFFRLITFQRWPRKYDAGNLIVEGENSLVSPLPYRSVFGYPVSNTGLEGIAVAFILLILFQCLPLPAGSLRYLSPTAYDLYSSAADAAEIRLSFLPLSIVPAISFSKALEYIAYFLIFMVVVNNVRSRRSFYVVLYAAVLSAVFQSIYGLFEMLSGHQHIFGYAKKFGIDSASGTFINRNHFATYLELAFPVIASLLAVRVLHLKTYRGKLIARISHALETEGSKILLMTLFVVLIAAGILFSLSRSGICFWFLSFGMFLFLYRHKTGALQKRSYFFPAVLGTLAIAAWIGVGPLMERFSRISENWQDGGARLQVWSDTFLIFLNFPLTGTGAGTFEQIFPMYRSFVMDSIYRQAHNDYLQILSETGFISIFLIIGAVACILRRLQSVLKKELHGLTILQLGAFCSLLSLALHSFTDFGLQIPAIAFQGAIIAGLFFTHYHAEHHETSQSA